MSSPRNTFPVAYGQTLIIRGLPKEHCNEWKWKLLTEHFQRYGQLDNVFVAANKGFGFVTFFRASAVRFVLGSRTSVVLKVRGFQLECSKTYCLNKVAENQEKRDATAFKNKENIKPSNCEKENAWWKQVPIEVDYTKAPVKKKKPRHRNTELAMGMEPGTTKKTKKGSSKKKNQKEKKKKRLFFCSSVSYGYETNVTESCEPTENVASHKSEIPTRISIVKTASSSNEDEVQTYTRATTESPKEGLILSKGEQEKSVIFVRFPNGFVFPYEAQLSMSLQEQIKDMEDTSGPFPLDAYLTHNDKLLEVTQTMKAQGITAGSNVDVNLRLKGGIDPGTVMFLPVNDM